MEKIIQMDQEMIQPFIDSSITALLEMAEIQLGQYDTTINSSTIIHVDGFASIVGFSGKIEGWVMINMDKELATRIAVYITGDENEGTDEEIISQTVSETCNVIVGNANTLINNRFSFRLRCAPPILFFGGGSKLSLPQVKSCTIDFKTAYGMLKIIVAFDAKLFY